MSTLRTTHLRKQARIPGAQTYQMWSQITARWSLYTEVADRPRRMSIDELATFGRSHA